MASEGFDAEEWDADFLDQLVQAEELALSTQISHQQHPQQPPRAPPSCVVSYSPPRELSQRTRETSYASGIPDTFDSFAPRGTHFAKEQELDRLKKELNRVSKQLNHLEQECWELRKERDKKEEQLKVVHSRIEVKDAEFHLPKSTERDCLVSTPEDPGTSAVRTNANLSDQQPGSWTKSCKTVGVQTDKTTESCGSEKLSGLWNSDNQELGRVLVAKLFMTCEEDFHVLFGYLNSQNDSGMTLSDQLCPQPIEATKVSSLFTVLTEISNGTSRLKDLLEALLDLCSLKNVVIVHRSLRVLHMILINSTSMEKEFGKRENVTFEEPFSENSKSDSNGYGILEKESLCFANVAEMLKQGPIRRGMRLSYDKTPDRSGFFGNRFGASISVVYWVSVFERMCQIAIKYNEEEIRREALSFMNLILMRHKAFVERVKFAGEPVFQCLSRLLRRGAGFSVQDQAVHTLYLLCNCPEVIARLSSGLEEDVEHACSKDINDKSISTFQGLNEILIGLADCVACYGTASAEELKLRRNAIVFLAFLGSSGKTGLEILINYSLPKGANFLAIILQSLKLDLDLQTLKPAQPSGIVREQCLLIREALILLNRLASHPQYSTPVLHALTNTRHMASTTVDIAARLTQKSKLLWQEDNTTKQIRESEIVDLAQVFKKRVFTFLGDSIS
ncbi:protein SENSITIVE TO UV 2 [Sesamum alatum]|uniref:Protein SENSITIVE TO UV 2 n=1 Tax=Sesamum alatum TaxID=300844 RepID=A0AAE2CV06_9LAMI|nr:protein SENSITIVE TO UV 2 [Sesamum alatum]